MLILYAGYSHLFLLFTGRLAGKYKVSAKQMIFVEVLVKSFLFSRKNLEDYKKENSSLPFVFNKYLDLSADIILFGLTWIITLGLRFY